MVDLQGGLPDPGDLLRDVRRACPSSWSGVRSGSGRRTAGSSCATSWSTRATDGLGRIAENLAGHPVAATTLALLLRGQRAPSVGAGLVAESAAYSVLQSGPEFAAWRAAHPARTERRRRTTGCGSTVPAGILSVTSPDPSACNALDALMRDELVEALDAGRRRSRHHPGGAAGRGPGLLRRRRPRRVRLQTGSGHGARDSPGAQRRARCSPACDTPTVAYLHGACMGSGIELAAFTDTVVAAAGHANRPARDRPRARARRGGDREPPRRIGRLRTAWLAFTGCTIDAATAHAWGLVDELVALRAVVRPCRRTSGSLSEQRASMRTGAGRTLSFTLGGDSKEDRTRPWASTAPDREHRASRQSREVVRDLDVPALAHASAPRGTSPGRRGGQRSLSRSREGPVRACGASRCRCPTTRCATCWSTSSRPTAGPTSSTPAGTPTMPSARCRAA